MQTAAARLSLSIDPEAALLHAQKAVAAAPNSAPALSALAQANLALGRADVAAEIADGLRLAWPNDQQPLAILAVAWRILGDPRYRKLYDYQRLVQPYALETPTGWATLEAYLTDLAESLTRLQRLNGHPVGQSLRQGDPDEPDAHPFGGALHTRLLCGHRRADPRLHRHARKAPG